VIGDGRRIGREKVKERERVRRGYERIGGGGLSPGSNREGAFFPSISIAGIKSWIIEGK
jgi:hypothetical protein